MMNDDQNRNLVSQAVGTVSSSTHAIKDTKAMVATGYGPYFAMSQRDMLVHRVGTRSANWELENGCVPPQQTLLDIHLRGISKISRLEGLSRE